MHSTNLIVNYLYIKYGLQPHIFLEIGPEVQTTVIKYN